MNIGLIDVDGHNFPNLALMRLAAYHKSRGDSVEWWDGFTHYDRVYKSKVFTFSPDEETCINADEIISGGTGYKDYGHLPDEIERTFPDYSLYPAWKPAIGFLTRGCIRNCPWCIVPKKEGHIRPAATWEEVKRPDSRDIVFMDNNVLASDHGLEQIDRMGHENVRVDFNQGCAAHISTDSKTACGPEMDQICPHELRYICHASSDRASDAIFAGGWYTHMETLVLCAGTRRG